jgi:hypothetical protein
MTVRRHRPLQLPTHWTSNEALAVFEFLDLPRDHLRLCYETDIQQACREEIQHCDPRQRTLCSDADSLF